MGLGLVFLVYFGSVLKTALDAGTAETSCLSRVAFAGVIVFVAGAATDFTLVVSMVEAAKDKVDPVAIQALSAYFENDFVPFAVGILLLTSASAISILKYGGAAEVAGLARRADHRRGPDSADRLGCVPGRRRLDPAGEHRSHPPSREGRRAAGYVSSWVIGLSVK